MMEERGALRMLHWLTIADDEHLYVVTRSDGHVGLGYRKGPSEAEEPEVVWFNPEQKVTFVDILGERAQLLSTWEHRTVAQAENGTVSLRSDPGGFSTARNFKIVIQQESLQYTIPLTYQWARALFHLLAAT